jgi:beta-galactosidase GanA
MIALKKWGKSKYISTFDMLKGYWAVPLSERAKDISAFATPSGLYHHKEMAMGLKNAASSYQRMMNRVMSGMCTNLLTNHIPCL